MVLRFWSWNSRLRAGVRWDADMRRSEARARIRPDFCVGPFGLNFGRVIWVKNQFFAICAFPARRR